MNGIQLTTEGEHLFRHVAIAIEQLTYGEKEIIKKWKEANPHMIIGECNTPEMKALIKEWKERYAANVEK
mgnify:FL=1